MARFDWYQATVSAEPVALFAALPALAEGQPAWEEMNRAPQGYGFGRRLLDDGGQVAQIWWGGSHPLPHVLFTGETAQTGADLLRSEFKAHRVSRVDVCTDYADPGAYDRLQLLALDVAKERKVKVGTAGDHLVTMEGRTLYLGSTSSHTRLRLYDKAAELRAKFANDLARLQTVPAELARFECQVRPQTPEAKAAAAIADPVALMGSAAWMRDLVRRVDGLSLEPFQAGRPWRQADDDRAYAALLAQYGGLLDRVRQSLGSWDCVGLQIGHDLAERAAAERRARR